MLYGASQLTESHVIMSLLPRCFLNSARYTGEVMTYLSVFPSLPALRELSLGRLQFLLQILILAELAVGIAYAAIFIIDVSSRERRLPSGNSQLHFRRSG